MKKLTVKKGTQCMACLECVRACSEAFYKEFDPSKACLQIIERNGAAKPMVCVQCGKCAEACEHGAITQNAKGVYTINKKLCVGCGKCKDACPFGVLVKVEEAFTPSLSDLPFKGDTVIGNDVWIGQHVTVLPGVHIGDGAINGANSVVTKDVPPYTIAGGNPCRVIRKRFSEELIAYLEEIRWWNWDADKIFRNMDALCSGDLEKIRRIQA